MVVETSDSVLTRPLQTPEPCHLTLRHRYTVENGGKPLARASWFGDQWLVLMILAGLCLPSDSHLDVPRSPVSAEGVCRRLVGCDSCCRACVRVAGCSWRPCPQGHGAMDGARPGEQRGWWGLRQMAAQVVARKSAEESLFELSLVIVSDGELACRKRGTWGGPWGPWPGTPVWRRAGAGRRPGRPAASCRQLCPQGA